MMWCWLFSDRGNHKISGAAGLSHCPGGQPNISAHQYGQVMGFKFLRQAAWVQLAVDRALLNNMELSPPV